MIRKVCVNVQHNIFCVLIDLDWLLLVRTNYQIFASLLQVKCKQKSKMGTLHWVTGLLQHVWVINVAEHNSKWLWLERAHILLIEIIFTQSTQNLQERWRLKENEKINCIVIFFCKLSTWIRFQMAISFDGMLLHFISKNSYYSCYTLTTNYYKSSSIYPELFSISSIIKSAIGNIFHFLHSFQYLLYK